MTPIQSQSIAAITSRIADVLVIALSLWLAYLLRGLDAPEQYVLAGFLALLLYLLAGAGKRTHRYSPEMTLAKEVWSALGVWVTTFAGLLVLAWMTKTTDHYSRIAIGLWGVFGAIGLLSWRLVLHLAPSFAGPAWRRRPVVIAGASTQARRFARFLTSTPAFHATLAGAFVENGVPEPKDGELPFPILGNFDTLVEQAGRHEFSAIFVALPASAEKSGHRLVAALSEIPATVYVVPSTFTEELAYARWVSLGGLPLISILETPLSGVNSWVKRLEDLVLSLLILAATAVPMLLIAAAVKLTSRGPVLFRQRRHGIDGREIRMFKFRTMTVAEDGAAVRHAVRNDSRLTPIGAFLRRTSLDEMPQFFNVLRGEMSVVGPRPHAIAINEHYRRLIPDFMLRHRVKPGITGWAQIHGWRGADTVEHMEERVRHDLWYVGRWSLWLDLWIVARTVVLLAGDRNAV